MLDKKLQMNEIQIEILGKWKIAWLETSRLDDYIQLVESNQIDGLGLLPHKGFEDNDLCFTKKLPKLRALIIPNCGSISINGLEQLHSLRFLSLGGVREGANLSGLERLEELSIEWHKNFVFPKKSEYLKSLALRKYCPKSKTLEELLRFPAIEFMEIVQGNIESLIGIDHLSKLSGAEFHYMKKLEFVSQLALTSVNKIVFTHCPHLKDVTTLGGCINLSSLFYHDSAALPDLKFVKESASLQEFRFCRVDVLDGDLSPLFKLKDTTFTDKKHFSHKLTDIQKAIKKG